MPIDSHLPQADPFSLFPTFKTRLVLSALSSCLSLSLRLSVCLYLRNTALLIRTVESKLSRKQEGGTEKGGIRAGKIGERERFEGFVLA